MTEPADLLVFWFADAVRPLWFKATPAFDDQLRARFGPAVETALGGGFEDWRSAPEPALALCLLLDQMPRNLFRGTARAFGGDPWAATVADRAVADGFDLAVPPERRLFFYLPFEHPEDGAAQERSVALFGALGDSVLWDDAVRHKAVIDRFGRFPHRNTILGRPSTAEENAFLKEPGSSF